MGGGTGLEGAAGWFRAWILLPLLVAPLAVPLARTVLTRTDGPALNATLGRTGGLLAAFSGLLAAGVLAS